MAEVSDNCSPFCIITNNNNNHHFVLFFNFLATKFIAEILTALKFPKTKTRGIRNVRDSLKENNDMNCYKKLKESALDQSGWRMMFNNNACPVRE